MTRDARVYVAGHRGLVGSAIVRRLKAAGYRNLLLRTRSELDLADGEAVHAFFQDEKPEFVFLAAARVGGIVANDTYPADFIRENLLIQTHVLDAAHRAGEGVEKLLYLGSSCIYPKNAPQPIREEYLLTGPLEPTNRAYAVAKIAGIEMCQAYARQFGSRFISAMPTNLYGPGDNFDPETSHVLPALLQKFHDAKIEGRTEVVIWGTGTPRREFLHVDDLADACLFLMHCYEDPEIINVGVGKDITILELAELVRDVVGFDGDIALDTSRPDGTARKLLDISRISSLGWKASTPLRDGITSTYRWFAEQYAGVHPRA